MKSAGIMSSCASDKIRLIRCYENNAPTPKVETPTQNREGTRNGHS